MNADLIFDNLNKLDDAKRFVSSLEINFSSDEKFLSQLKIAKNSLDKALVSWVFDIEKKLENFQQNQFQKIKISDQISIAYDQLKDFSDESLTQCLQDLAIFTKNYEDNTVPIQSTKTPEDLKNLRAKILLITSERFG